MSEKILAHMTAEERETLVLARSLIRDMAHGWPLKELAGDPRATSRPTRHSIYFERIWHTP